MVNDKNNISLFYVCMEWVACLMANYEVLTVQVPLQGTDLYRSRRMPLQLQFKIKKYEEITFNYH